MARISKYQNDKTEDSLAIIETITTEAEKITLHTLDVLQQQFGISDVNMAQLMGMHKGQYSGVKTGRNTFTHSHKMTIALIMRLLNTSAQ